MADIELMLIETIDDGNCEINKIRKTSPVTKSEFQSHDFENPINSRYVSIFSIKSADTLDSDLGPEFG